MVFWIYLYPKDHEFDSPFYSFTPQPFLTGKNEYSPSLSIYGRTAIGKKQYCLFPIGAVSYAPNRSKRRCRFDP